MINQSLLEESGRLDERVAKQIPQTKSTRVPVIYNNKDARCERLPHSLGAFTGTREPRKPPYTCSENKRICCDLGVRGPSELQWPSLYVAGSATRKYG
jgi:hypothetical protein